MRDASNSFRFMAIGPAGEVNFVTQDRRRSRNVVTGVTSTITLNPDAEPHGLAKVCGAAVVVRWKLKGISGDDFDRMLMW